MKMRLVVPALAALLLVPAAWGQSSAAAAPAKIGVLNIQVAITSTGEGKQASAELQTQFAPRIAELQNLQKQIEDLQTRARTTANTASDEEKARLQQENDKLTRTFQRKQQEMNDDSQEAQKEVVDHIGRKMMDVLDKYSKENSFAVVLDTASQQSSVLYASNAIDVTQEIIRLYDQTYPLKAAAAAAKPAAPKPAAPAPKPQR
jgi:outer membrane protein